MGNQRYVPGSKWKKHRIALRSEALREHLPDTALYSRKALGDYAGRYDVLFLKPEYGGGGKGVMRVTRRYRHGWVLRAGRRQWTCDTLDELNRRVEGQRFMGRRLLIQKGIDLARWKGRPVDLRTVVQKNERNEWEISGMVAKAAGAGLAVTNVCAGGSAHRIDAYLQGIGYDRTKREEAMRRLKKLTFDVARTFSKGRVNVTYGLDVGLDRQGRFWVIEVNTAPQLGMLKKAKQTKMFQRATKLWRLRNGVNSGARALAQKKPGRRMG